MTTDGEKQRNVLLNEANRLPALQDPGPNLKEAELNALLESKGFTVGAKLGGGAYGTVHYAKSKTIPDEEIACKIVDITRNKSKHFLGKFFPRELFFLRKLVHINLVRCYSIEGPFNGTYYIFMELCMGGDLLDWLRVHGTQVPESQARIWFKQMVKGLNYIHSMGVAHRDIKLENILLDDFGTIKISDLGFARPVLDVASRKTVLSKTYCGSAIYVAPEIIQNVPYNPFYSDIWSLGVVLFVLLNNRFPFDDSDLKKMVARQLKGDFTFSSRVRDILSLDSKDLVTRILAPLPAMRASLKEIYEHAWISNDIMNA